MSDRIKKLELEILEMCKNESYKKVAKHFNVSSSTVYNIAKKYGVNKKSGKKPGNTPLNYRDE